MGTPSVYVDRIGRQSTVSDYDTDAEALREAWDATKDPKACEVGVTLSDGNERYWWRGIGWKNPATGEPIQFTLS